MRSSGMCDMQLPEWIMLRWLVSRCIIMNTMVLVTLELPTLCDERSYSNAYLAWHL